MNDKDFNRNKKVFFEGKVSDTESVYNAATAKFFGANDPKKADVGDKFGAVQATVDPQREAYRKSAAAFAGESYQAPQINAPTPSKNIDTKTGTFKADAKKFYAIEKAETESQGSQFQRNAAAFMDTD